MKTHFTNSVLIVLLAWLIPLSAQAGNGGFPSGSWRYKMTVEVETPDGLKRGSAVREVDVQYRPYIQGLTQTQVKVYGEAVVVDLGKRGILFALT